MRPQIVKRNSEAGGCLRSGEVPQSLEGVSKAGGFLIGWRASQRLDGVSESGRGLRSFRALGVSGNSRHLKSEGVPELQWRLRGKRAPENLVTQKTEGMLKD